MWGFEEIYAIIKRLIGMTSDVSNSAGTVFARLAYLGNAIPESCKKYGMKTTLVHAGYTKTSAVAGTYYAVASVSGASGYIYRAGCYASDGNDLATLRVVIDGTTYVLTGMTGENFAASADGKRIDFTGPIKYLSSFSVDVMTTVVSRLDGYVQWGTDL